MAEAPGCSEKSANLPASSNIGIRQPARPPTPVDCGKPTPVKCSAERGPPAKLPEPVAIEAEVPKVTAAPVEVAPPNRGPAKCKQLAVNGKTFSVMKALGHGGSSVVYQVLNAAMDDIFALKVVRLDCVDKETAEGFLNEVRLLQQLQGLPRVVRLLELYDDEYLK